MHAAGHSATRLTPCMALRGNARTVRQSGAPTNSPGDSEELNDGRKVKDRRQLLEGKGRLLLIRRGDYELPNSMQATGKMKMKAKLAVQQASLAVKGAR